MPLDRPLLNLSGGKNPADDFTVRHLFENIYIAGSTGTGKTSGSGYALACSMLNAQGLRPEERIGIIVFLYKKEDAQDWLHWTDAHGRQQDVIHLQAHHTNVYNILEQYEHKEPMNAVAALMSLSQLSLSGGNRRESESYWEIEQAKRLDRLIRLVTLARLPLTIDNLYKVHVSSPIEPLQMKDQEFRGSSFCWQMLEQAAERSGEECPDFKLVEDYFLREMVYLADRTSSSIRAMTSGVLEPFISSSLLKNFFGGTSNFHLEEAFRGRIVLLDIPIAIHGHAGRVLQCVFKYAFQKAVEQRDLKQYPNPVVFWQDEAQAFLVGQSDFAFMSTCRSSRAGSVLLTQNISNFYATLGGGPQAEAQVNSLLGLCNIKIFHANNDYVTNEWAAKTIGMGIRNLTSFSVGHSNDSATSTQHMQYLVEPREFTMLRTGGAGNDYLVDAVIAGTGRVFSTEANFLPTTFRQPQTH